MITESLHRRPAWSIKRDDRLFVLARQPFSLPLDIKACIHAHLAFKLLTGDGLLLPGTECQ